MAAVMKRSDATSPQQAAPSEVVARRRPDADNRRTNRRSLEFPQRKIFDAHRVLDKVKKSYSFDQNCDGDVIAKIVEDRFSGAIATRKVQLANEKGEKPKAVASSGNDSDKKSSHFGIKLLSEYLNGKQEGESKSVHCEGDPQSLPSGDRRGVHLRQGTRSSSSTRCRSTPPWTGAWAPPWATERAGGRLCRTWYGGYGTLTEDDNTSQRNLTEKTVALSTVAAVNGQAVGAGQDGGAGPVAAAGASAGSGAKRRGCGGGGIGIDGRSRRAVARARDPPVAPPSPGLTASTLSLNLLPRLSAAVIPLRRGGLARSAATLLEEGGGGAPLLGPPAGTLRKCETMAALGEPQRAVNRLRVCSRCSSLLSLAGGGSRYSLAAAGGGFVPVGPPLLCKLCLDDVPRNQLTSIKHCGCSFCTRCMQSYVEYEVLNGAYDISCPDSRCPRHGVMGQSEVEALVNSDLVDKYRKFRLNHEVVMDGGRAFCPRVGCETVCHVGCGGGPVSTTTPQPVRCPTCDHHFCSACTNQWHAGMDCAAYSRQLAMEAAAEGLPAESDLIKWCPMCRVPIEKDEGCAQMMCKRCKHVFCWYCLASLDDDFLLRHYDKGPCKNKLGHSRASVIWHRAQVVGIFAGFGLLLLVASPLLLLAAPCIVCCKCRLCNSNGGKTIDGDEQPGMDMDMDPEDVGDEIQKQINSPVID